MPAGPTGADFGKGTQNLANLQSAARVVHVLEFLARVEGAGLDEVATELGVHKSNALRLLATLRDFDWVTLDRTRSRYSLGPRLVTVGQAATSGQQFEQAIGLAREVRDLTGETAHICVPYGDRMLVVGRVDSTTPLKVTTDVGWEDHLHASAVGKVFLATLSDGELELVLNRLDLAKLTPSSIDSRDALLEDIRLIRERGYAINQEEQQSGTTAIGVALGFGVGPLSIISLSASGPANRFSPAVMEGFAPAILEIVRPYQALDGLPGSADGENA